MRKLLALVSIPVTLALSGCAYLHSTTRSSIDPNPTNHVVTVTTHVTSYTLFDSQASLTKFNNRGETVGTNEWAAGTYMSNLSQASSSTNLNDIIGAVVGAAVKAAIKP